MTIALLGLSLFVASFAVASAEEAAATAPGALCAENDDFLVPAQGGCASSVSHDFVLTTAAYVAQRKWIEENDPPGFYADFHIPTEEEPYDAFGGKIESCVVLLELVHTHGH